MVAGQKVNGKGPGVESLLRPLQEIEATYRAFNEAEKILVGSIGVPVCVDGCGKCCQTTVPMVWDAEAKFAVSWLLGMPVEYREKVLATCEGWLLDREGRLGMHGVSGLLSQDQWDRLRPEVDILLGVNGTPLPCPFLSDTRCVVHEGRPLVCRAYGVTRMAAIFCPRPLSRMEASDARAHISENSQAGQKLLVMVDTAVRSSHQVGMGGSRFLPTSIYMTLRPAKYDQMLHLIPTAKTVILNQNPSILFQSQLNEVWRTEQLKSREQKE